jgi:guanine deaminase
MSSNPTIYYGSIVTPESLTSLRAHPRALLAVNAQGIIDWLEEDVDSSMIRDVLAKKGLFDVHDVVELKNGEFLMPGFIDTHTVRLNHD